MKLYILKFIGVTLVPGVLLCANNKILKSELPKHNIIKEEPNDKIPSSSRDECPVVYPNNSNSILTQVDESTNGYGMVSSVTRLDFRRNLLASFDDDHFQNRCHTNIFRNRCHTNNKPE